MRPWLALALALAWASNVLAQPVAIGGDASRGHALAEQRCAGCHGQDGNTVDPYFPKLAGQGAFYLFDQLQAFKQGRRPQGGVMNAMAADLEAQQMRDLAAWYETQPPALPAVAATQVSDAAAQRGEFIWMRGIPKQKVAACASCHAVSGAGLPPEYPRLAGQHPAYIERQLRAFRSGARDSNPNRLMREVAHAMSDRDIDAVSRYIGLLH